MNLLTAAEEDAILTVFEGALPIPQATLDTVHRLYVRLAARREVRRRFLPQPKRAPSP